MIFFLFSKFCGSADFIKLAKIQCIKMSMLRKIFFNNNTYSTWKMSTSSNFTRLSKNFNKQYLNHAIFQIFRTNSINPFQNFHFPSPRHKRTPMIHLNIQNLNQILTSQPPINTIIKTGSRYTSHHIFKQPKILSAFAFSNDDFWGF